MEVETVGSPVVPHTSPLGIEIGQKTVDTGGSLSDLRVDGLHSLLEDVDSALDLVLTEEVSC